MYRAAGHRSSDFTLKSERRSFYGVVHMGQVAGSEIFAKVASRLMPGEGVGLVSEGGKHDFRTFQNELAIIGTKNFANG